MWTKKFLFVNSCNKCCLKCEKGVDECEEHCYNSKDVDCEECKYDLSV